MSISPREVDSVVSALERIAQALNRLAAALEKR